MLAYRLRRRAQLRGLFVIGIRQPRELAAQRFKTSRLCFGKLAAFALFLVEAVKGSLGSF